MMRVRNEVKVYEVDDDDEPIGSDKVLLVEAHWNDKRRVVLTGLDGVKLAVLVSELEAAIRNATNTGR